MVQHTQAARRQWSSGGGGGGVSYPAVSETLRSREEGRRREGVQLSRGVFTSESELSWLIVRYFQMGVIGWIAFGNRFALSSCLNMALTLEGEDVRNATITVLQMLKSYRSLAEEND